MFFIFEFIASFCFNIKIKKIDEKKHKSAALLGSVSTFLFITMSLSAPLIADGIGQIWFIFAGAFMMSIGNIIALLLLRPFENWIEKNINKKEKL